MNNKIINLALLLALSGTFMVGCNDGADGPSVPVPDRLKANQMDGNKNLWILKKDNDDAWRIWDEHGNNMGYLMVTAGDEITWNAHGSAMTFEFEEQDLSSWFIDEERRFSEGGTASLESGESLRVVIREDAPNARLVYNVHVAEADTVVEGNSPPVLIVF